MRSSAHTQTLNGRRGLFKVPVSVLGISVFRVFEVFGVFATFDGIFDLLCLSQSDARDDDHPETLRSRTRMLTLAIHYESACIPPSEAMKHRKEIPVNLFPSVNTDPAHICYF